MSGADIVWVSVSTALVMLMTPALAFFYGGLLRKKNLVSVLAQCLAIFAVVSLVWALWGYSFAFAPSVGGSGFIGDLSAFGLNGIAPSHVNSAYSDNLPELLFFAFQMMFAAITPALIVGAFAERVRFKSLLIFVVLWSTAVHVPVIHWVWSADGWLRSLGVIDFAGGITVHLTAGVSALAAALAFGKRRGIDITMTKPSNVAFVLLGAGLLWFGWFGFNGGSALAANEVAVSALVATSLSGAAAAVSWMVVDWKRLGKPSAVGLAVGGVCGLAAVTPASGFVGVPAAIVIGFVAGIISNLASVWLKKKGVDDSLDVFACHGLGGVWGSIATGLFASKAINPGGADGLFFGNAGQLVVQVEAVCVVALFAFVVSFLLLKLVGLVSPLRVTAEEEEMGLDESQHGEKAYGED